MLTAEENLLITKTGPGTPMGELMRQYWIPALLSSELPEPDCSPVRVKLLSEELVAFRDTDGVVGLIDNACPHRRASLFFGRNEECGLRCVYHGWKFDINGNCVDMPSEPAESNFKDKVKIKAYSVQERGGILWTYMGPRQEPPPLPELEANMLPEQQSSVWCSMRECNWLQALEGDVDTGHIGFLHMGTRSPGDFPEGSFDYYTLKSRAPEGYEVRDTEYGVSYGAWRPTEEGARYWRVAHFLFPFYAMIPTGVVGIQILARAWVPIDDTHTMLWHMTKSSNFLRGDDNGGKANLTPRGPREFLGSNFKPNTSEWLGRMRLEVDGSTDYGINREAQKTKQSWTGIEGIHMQDQAVMESMGPITDRVNEHLGASDQMVIRTRSSLVNTARAFQEGVTPPGVDNPEVYGVRSGGVFLPGDANWWEATKELRKAFVEHPEMEGMGQGKTA